MPISQITQGMSDLLDAIVTEMSDAGQVPPSQVGAVARKKAETALLDSLANQSAKATDDKSRSSLGDEIAYSLVYLMRRHTNTGKRSERVTKLANLEVLREATCTVLGTALAQTKQRQAGVSTYVKVLQAYAEERLAATRRLSNGAERPSHLNRLRINNIAYAEAALVELLRQGALKSGLELELLPVPWADVPLALQTGRIDVAIYNDEMERKFFSHFGARSRRPLYKSSAAFLFCGYDLLRAHHEDCKGKSDLSRRIAVPFGHDIDALIEALQRGSVENPLDAAPEGGFGALQKLPVESAEAALTFLAEGQAQYAITGPIHRAFAKDILGQRYGFHVVDEHETIWLKNGDEKTPDGKEFLKGVPKQLEVKFWTVSDRFEDAEERLGGLSRVWNHYVKTTWERLRLGGDDNIKERQKALVEIINASSEQVFVTDFADLMRLIERYNKIQVNCAFPGNSRPVTPP